MKTVFGLFTNVDNAQRAVVQLFEQGYPQEQMNAIIQESVAKDYLGINKPEINIEKSARIGSRETRGLETLFGGHQSIVITDTGKVFAAGTIASTVAKTAVSRPDGGLMIALKEFDIPENIAESYRNGIISGGVLFWIKTDDIRAGEIIVILDQQKAQHILSLPEMPSLR